MTKTTITKERREQLRAWGKKGGRKTSAKKRRAVKNNLKVAWEGSSVARLVRDVERKMLYNREEYCCADDFRRSELDAQFDKWVKVRDGFKRRKKNNGDGK